MKMVKWCVDVYQASETAQKDETTPSPAGVFRAQCQIVNGIGATFSK
jgi:hypothetical protein